MEETAVETIRLVKGISKLMNDYKVVLRPLLGKQYKHELINNLFFHPYTKIEFMEKDLMLNRKTVAKYLDLIVDAGLLRKEKVGKVNYYINMQLVDLFVNHAEQTKDIPVIESISG